MINKPILIVSYGGAGGDTLSKILTKYLGYDETPFEFNQYNRMWHPDLCDNELKTYKPRQKTISHYGLPDAAWVDIPREEIRRYIRSLVSERPRRRVICYHDRDPQLDLRYIFSDFFMLDLNPRVETSWLVRVLQLYKTMFEKCYYVHTAIEPEWRDYVQARIDRDGWYPDYWNWNPSEYCRYDPPEFVVRYSRWNLYTYDGPTDWHMDAFDFLTDHTLRQLDILWSVLGIPQMQQEDRDKMIGWANKNREILEVLGAWEHRDRQLTPDENVELVRRCLLDNYQRIIDQGPI
jgi:hypothetical protein